jgi:hypothetical protein
MSQKPAFDEAKRQRGMQNLIDQLKIADVVRQNAAATPIAQAPQTTVEDAAAAQGIAPMSHDVASAAATFVPQPKRDISITLPNGKKMPLAPLDYEEEAQSKKISEQANFLKGTGQLATITPEFNAQLPEGIRALFPAGSNINPAIAASFIKSNKYMPIAKTDPLTGITSYHIFDAERGAWVPDPGPSGGNQDDTTPNYNLKGEEFLNTLPPQRRNLVRDIALGKVKAPVSFGRTGAGLALLQDVTSYDPTGYDQSVVNARWQARQDLAKGGQYSAKTIMSALGQAAKHINELEQKSNDLRDAGWSGHDSQLWNAGEQMILPKGKQAAVTGYKSAAQAVKSEFIRALKNGVPSVEEEKALKDIDDPTLPEANRLEAIKTMRQFIQARANQQEEQFQNIFHHPSTEDEIQLINPSSGWKWDKDTGWQIPGLSESDAVASNKQAKQSPGGPAKPVAPVVGATPMTLDDLLAKHGFQQKPKPAVTPDDNQED